MSSAVVLAFSIRAHSSGETAAEKDGNGQHLSGHIGEGVESIRVEGQMVSLMAAWNTACRTLSVTESPLCSSKLPDQVPELFDPIDELSELPEVTQWNLPEHVAQLSAPHLHGRSEVYVPHVVGLVLAFSIRARSSGETAEKDNLTKLQLVHERFVSSKVRGFPEHTHVDHRGRWSCRRRRCCCIACRCFQNRNPATRCLQCSPSLLQRSL